MKKKILQALLIIGIILPNIIYAKKNDDYLNYATNIKWNSLNEPFTLVFDKKNKLIWALQTEYIDYIVKNKPNSLIEDAIYKKKCEIIDSLIEDKGEIRLCKKRSKIYDRTNAVIGNLSSLEINLQKEAWRKPHRSEIEKNNPFKKYQKYFRSYGGPNYNSGPENLSIDIYKRGSIHYDCTKRKSKSWSSDGYCSSGLYNGKLKIGSSRGLGSSIIIPVREPSTKYDKVIFNNSTNLKKLSQLIKLLTEERLKVEKKTLQKPIKLKAIKMDKLTKGEFEKTIDFNIRKKQEKQRVVKLNKLNEQEYNQTLLKYKKNINIEEERYNKKVAYNNKKSVIKNVVGEVVSQAITMLFGDPNFKNLTYDADKEIFNATLYSSLNNFSMKIKIPVSIDKAKKFKSQLTNKEYVPSVRFKIENGKLIFKDMQVVTNIEKEKQDFEIAKAKNTYSAYSDFIKFHPNAPQVKEAKIAQDIIIAAKVKREEKIRKRALEREKAKEERQRKMREAHYAKKYVGDKVCKDGTTAIILSITITAYVEKVNGNNIQLRISDTEGTSPHMNGVTLYRNTLIWDDYSSWYKCNH